MGWRAGPLAALAGESLVLTDHVRQLRTPVTAAEGDAPQTHTYS